MHPCRTSCGECGGWRDERRGFCTRDLLRAYSRGLLRVGLQSPDPSPGRLRLPAFALTSSSATPQGCTNGLLHIQYILGSWNTRPSTTLCAEHHTSCVPTHIPDPWLNPPAYLLSPPLPNEAVAAAGVVGGVAALPL